MCFLHRNLKSIVEHGQKWGIWLGNTNLFVCINASYFLLCPLQHLIHSSWWWNGRHEIQASRSILFVLCFCMALRKMEEYPRSGRERRAHQIYKTNTTGGIAIYRLDRERLWISRSTIAAGLDYDYFLSSSSVQDGAASVVSRNGCIPQLRWAYDLFFFSPSFQNVFWKRKSGGRTE